jgi:hypothetical protein
LSVVILHIAAVFVADQHSPIVLIDRAFVLGKNHAENVRLIGIVPHLVQHPARVVVAEETKVVGEVDLGQTIFQRDRPGLPFQLGYQRQDLVLGQIGRFIRPRELRIRTALIRSIILTSTSLFSSR